MGHQLPEFFSGTFGHQSSFILRTGAVISLLRCTEGPPGTSNCQSPGAGVMDPTEVARHIVPQVQLESSLGSRFHLAVSLPPLFQGVSDGRSASLPLALSSDWGFPRGQGAPRHARDSPLGVGAPRPPPPPRSCRSAPLRAGIWAQRGVGWRELAAANSGVVWLGGREETRVRRQEPGSGPPAQAAQEVRLLRQAAGSPAGEPEGGRDEPQGPEPRTREPSGGKDHGDPLAQVPFFTDEGF